MLELNELTNDQLISLYPKLLKELTVRKIAVTDNLVGEIGEYKVIKYYTETTNLPKLIRTAPSTKNVDAISTNGERYAIKSRTAGKSKTTSVFHSIPISDDKPYFEYLIVVILSKGELGLLDIYECDWKTFVKHRKIKNPEQKYFISITQKFLDDCKNILN